MVQRLLKYQDYVQEVARRPDRGYVSSAELAGYVRCESSLVRRDLSGIGVEGRPKAGYSVPDVLKCLTGALRRRDPPRAVLFGVGRLGSLLLRHDWNHQAGVVLAAAFDSDRAKLETATATAVLVQDVVEAPRTIRRCKARIAILAIGCEAAQACADLAVAAGVQAIWNFAPCGLQVPADVVVRNENLAAGLKELVCTMPRPKRR